METDVSSSASTVMPMVPSTDVIQDVADAVVWLSDLQAQAILDAIEADEWLGARAVALAAMPHLVDHVDLPGFAEALEDEISARLLPVGEADDQSTQHIPDYTRFAAQIA